MLALHGWTPDHRLMTGCLEPIFAKRPGYRRLYPDLPGMGQSPAGEIDSSDGIMAALREFIDAEIGAEPFILLGESYGGYLARGLVAERPDQILGLGLICPIGQALEHADRTVPDHVVLESDPAVLAKLTPEQVEDFTGIAVVQTAETLRQYQQDIEPGLDAADAEAMARIRKNWALTIAPESGPVLHPADADPLRPAGLVHRLSRISTHCSPTTRAPRTSYSTVPGTISRSSNRNCSPRWSATGCTRIAREALARPCPRSLLAGNVEAWRLGSVRFGWPLLVALTNGRTRIPDDRLAAAVRGKVVLVTGSSYGIGEATAKRLARAGATVLLLARTAEQLEIVAEEIRADGRQGLRLPGEPG